MISGLNHEELKVSAKLKEMTEEIHVYKNQVVVNVLEEIVASSPNVDQQMVDDLKYVKDEKNNLEEKLRKLRKSKSEEMNNLVKIDVEIKHLTKKKVNVAGPVEQKFHESFKKMKLKDEVYFKETTFVGNNVHKILEDFNQGKHTQTFIQ